MGVGKFHGRLLTHDIFKPDNYKQFAAVMPTGVMPDTPMDSAGFEAARDINPQIAPNIGAVALPGIPENISKARQQQPEN